MEQEKEYNKRERVGKRDCNWKKRERRTRI